MLQKTRRHSSSCTLPSRSHIFSGWLTVLTNSRSPTNHWSVCYNSSFTSANQQVNVRFIGLYKENVIWIKCRRPTLFALMNLLYNSSILCPEKGTKMFFVLSPIKLERGWENLVYRFFNKFAEKMPKYGVNVLQITWIMSLQYVVKRSLRLLSCYRKKLQNLYHCNCGF